MIFLLWINKVLLIYYQNLFVDYILYCINLNRNIYWVNQKLYNVSLRIVLEYK